MIRRRSLAGKIHLRLQSRNLASVDTLSPYNRIIQVRGPPSVNCVRPRSDVGDQPRTSEFSLGGRPLHYLRRVDPCRSHGIAWHPRSSQSPHPVVLPARPGSVTSSAARSSPDPPRGACSAPARRPRLRRWPWPRAVCLACGSACRIFSFSLLSVRSCCSHPLSLSLPSPPAPATTRSGCIAPRMTGALLSPPGVLSDPRSLRLSRLSRRILD